MKKALLVGACLAFLSMTSCRFASRVSAEVFANSLLLEVRDPLEVQPPETVLVVRVGLIEDATSENPKFEPIVGAEVVLESEDLPFNTIVVDNAEDGEVPNAQGAYVVTSQDTALEYMPGARYTVRITVPAGDHQGEYSMSIVAPAASEVMGFPDTLGGETHPVDTPMTLNIEPANEYEHGLVLVVEDTGGGNPEVVYDSTPQSAVEWITFLIGSFGGEVTIPEGERDNPFTTSGQAYGVGVTGIKTSIGPDESANLHLLSEFLAGSMETAIVCTDPACSLP